MAFFPPNALSFLTDDLRKKSICQKQKKKIKKLVYVLAEFTFEPSILVVKKD